MLPADATMNQNSKIDRLPEVPVAKLDWKNAGLLLVLVAYVLNGSCCPQWPAPSSGYYQVSIERGRYRTATGERVCYDLFIPQPDPALPSPPWPAVVLNHGFARDHTHQRNNALYLAERGVVVLTPDMGCLLGGEDAQLQNIVDLVGEVAWMAERSATPGDALNGVLDPARIGLAGHSAGGAVSFEAAIDAQSTPTPVAAVCLMDAVPWDRTIARAAEFPALPFACWRSEPEPCNADGEVRFLLNRLSFPTEDVLIVGGTHCDPENPSDAACALACGCSAPERQSLYQQFLYLFVRDTLHAPDVPSEPASYEAALDEATAVGSVVRTATGQAENCE